MFGNLFKPPSLESSLPPDKKQPGQETIWDKNGGIYLGINTNALTKKEDEELQFLSEFLYTSDRHIMTFGPNGSGKTRRLLVENLIRLTEWSMLVIDPKGELAKITSAHRAKHGKVIYLDPFKISGFPSTGFNPIMALDPDSPEFPDDALALADAIIKITGQEKEPHWVNSAQDLMTALIMYARLIEIFKTEGQPPEFVGNFRFVRDMLGQTAEQFKGTITHIMKTAEIRQKYELYVKAARFAEINPRNQELNSILSTALTQTRWLDSEPIKVDLEQPFFDFADMKKTPITIYLILPSKRLSTQSPWLRLIIASAMQKLMDDTKKAEVPTLLMLEEMAQLGHLSAIENNIALMRGYNVKVWGVFQDLSQIKDIYSKRWESFLGNAGVFNSFAPQDLTTAKYVSDMAGINTVQVETISQKASLTNLKAPETTINMAPTVRPTIYPQDVRDIDEGFTLAFSHKSKGIISAYAPFYFENPDYADFAKLDPSFRD